MSTSLPLFQCLRCIRRESLARLQHSRTSDTVTVSLNPLPSRNFTSGIVSRSQQSRIIRQKRRDAYAVAQAKARKAANLSRQQVLQQEQAENLGDPVHGVETAFVASFDNPPISKQQNFYVADEELQQTIRKSAWLNTPSEEDFQKQELVLNKEGVADLRRNAEEVNKRAAEALQRISNLQLGSSKDRLRINVQRCISEFGRHNTDQTLPPNPSAIAADGTYEPSQSTRIGIDTGSSEVQIAILTARIRVLASNLEARGSQDKHNKRNLRLLVHRRQKLLQYLRRKERGGPRWQNVISSLGLTEGTWKGEITLPR